ncbi:P1 family peptidase [uncultured Paracoccus sp.]|uniref:P1 family peptidase n=1 Tax=uncultured Paracoccus sp. TaxID=189685 RepID=UPI0025E360B0|nr:P1 family peptidase [uncultured Paracoccus sp.]
MRDHIRPGGWWTLQAGPGNAITDVAGVKVGQVTLDRGPVQTGFSAVLPHGGDLFAQPVPAGVCVLNGFGKSAGLMQLAELGQIETPILLTNTFSVAAGTEALIRRAIADNPQIGRSLPTVNPLVLECNDGRVNDIQAMALRPDHALAAIGRADGGPVRQGTVGAGRGMVSFGLSGGIGTASRLCGGWVLGALVLSNFGQPGELRVMGRRLQAARPEAEKGSIIMLLATDAPLDSRQLSRLARRSAAGLGRLGSHLGHGSGDIAVAFSTALPTADANGLLTCQRLAEPDLDPLFLATAEAVEEAVLNALWHAEPVPRREGPATVLRDMLAWG